MKNGNSDRRSMFRTVGLFSVIVADIAVYTGAGLGLGYWLWKTQDWPRWVPIITTLLGLGLAFYHLYLISKKLWKD